MAERTGERLTKRKAMGRLTSAAAEDPVAELFRRVTTSSLVFWDRTAEENPEYVGKPAFLLVASTYKPGMRVTVEYSQTPLGRQTISALKFVNGRMYGSVHKIGYHHPHKIGEKEWEREWEEITIGPGLILARHRQEIGNHGRLVNGLYEALTHSFTYDNVRSRDL